MMRKKKKKRKKFQNRPYCKLLDLLLGRQLPSKMNFELRWWELWI
jgi:hypothetical protein